MQKFLANIDGRAVITDGESYFDIYEKSKGTFGPSLQSLYDCFDEFLVWLEDADLRFDKEIGSSVFLPPSPRPTQIFAIGVNYVDHAREAEMPTYSMPVVFTKFQSSLAGDNVEVELVSEYVDYEIELVVIISKFAKDVPSELAGNYIAGYTVGQDISERKVQFATGEHFSLGKSYPNFAPIGPYLAFAKDVNGPFELELTLNDRVVQKSSTSKMIFSVNEIVSQLSRIVTLYPGDVIFTGTPSGVGFVKNPPEFLKSGDILVSSISSIGTLTTKFKKNIIS